MATSLACGNDVVIVNGGSGGPEPVPRVDPPVPEPPEPAEPPPPPPDPKRENDAAWVFAEDEVRTYELVLTDADWAALQATALDEEYFPATLSVDGIPYGSVGLRFKGSRGTLGRCGRGVGTPTCPKISFKIKFDEYEEQRFFGLKRLNFNSMWADPTWMHERLAYGLYREMGIAAPQATHARIVVNGDDRGVFSLVEQIDGRFTDNHFVGGDGNLYKEQWPLVSSASQLNRTLETNEETADHSLMIRVHEELAAASADELSEVVARYWDVDELFAYLAVDRATTNWDGVTGYYCRGGGCYNHNYYLYQHEHEDRLTLIPWDLDNTFRPITPFDRMPMPLDMPEDCSDHLAVFPPSVYGMAPGCDPVFRGLAQSGRERYAAQLDRLLEGPFDLDRLNAWINVRFKQLLPLVETDSYGPGVLAFKRAVATLRRDLPTIVERVEAERDGVLDFFWLNPEAVNDFESTNSISLKLGIRSQVDPVCILLTSLEASAALRGQNDLVFDFQLAPETDPDLNWLNARLRFASDHLDLSTKKGVHLVLQADSPRTIRIAIESPINSPYFPAAYGWNVNVDETTRELDLDFADADYPSSGPAIDGTLADALSNTSALLIQFRPLEGRVPGVVDSGRLRVDDIRIVPY